MFYTAQYYLWFSMSYDFHLVVCESCHYCSLWGQDVSDTCFVNRWTTCTIRWY